MGNRGAQSHGSLAGRAAMAGLPEALPMRTGRDRVRTDRPSDVTEVGIVSLVMLIGFLAGTVLPSTNFAQVAP